MPAVLHPIPGPPAEIEIQVASDPWFIVSCDRCRWAPEGGPQLEAAARIAAYEHNAARHPKASVSVLTPGQTHAAMTRRLRRGLLLMLGFAVVVALAQGLVLFGVGTPVATMLTVALYTGLAVHAGVRLGRDQLRLSQHRAHPPGSIGVILSPPPDATDGEVHG